jgi:serine/threonine-protein kinase
MKSGHLGKYEILSEIGRGGFGTVYEARDTELERRVALKVLHPTLMQDPHLLQRFRQEAQSAARLEHPRIVTIYDVGQSEDRHYIAMRLLKGEPLSALLARKDGPLPVDQALAILGDIARALDYAHEQGVIHRDVKPSNVFTTVSGAILTDFGIVRVLGDESRVTTTGQALGTPEYMAPEQIKGEDVGPKTDIYALSVVAYEMLTGRVPFTGTTPFAIQEGHVRRPLPSARSLNPTLPAKVDAVLERALAKSPEQRPASAVQFVKELEHLLNPSPVPQPGYSPSPAQLPVRSRSARRGPIPRWLWFAVPLLLFGAYLGIWGSGWPGRYTSPLGLNSTVPPPPPTAIEEDSSAPVTIQGSPATSVPTPTRSVLVTAESTPTTTIPLLTATSQPILTAEPVFIFHSEKNSGLCLFDIGSAALNNESGELIWIEVDLAPGTAQSFTLPPGRYTVNSYWDYDKSPSAPKWFIQATQGKICNFRCIDEERTTMVSDCE